MSPQRARMIEDMILAGLAQGALVQFGRRPILPAIG
jgi:hypothetical protein